MIARRANNEQEKVKQEKAFSFNNFHPDFDEFPIPETDLSFNMGSGKKSKESEISRAIAKSKFHPDYDEFPLEIDLSFRMGVGKKANEPELSMANSISTETPKQPRLGNVFPSVDGMMVAPNRYGCESIRPILQVNVSDIYQVDDELVVAFDRNGELNPWSTACNVPVLFVDKFSV